MIEIITTESGSVYEIDDEQKTWTRTRGEGAAELRSDSGTFIGRAFVFGCLQLICPPFFNPDVERVEDYAGKDLRIITSTQVVKRERKESV